MVWIELSWFPTGLKSPALIEPGVPWRSYMFTHSARGIVEPEA